MVAILPQAEVAGGLTNGRSGEAPTAVRVAGLGRERAGTAIEIQSDLPGATRGTYVVLGAKRDPGGQTGAIAGPFRQITGKIDTPDGVPDEGALKAAAALLAGWGVKLFERGAEDDRALFMVAPAETLVPVSAVPDLLRIARPRLRWPRRIPGNPKIGRLARVRPPELQEARDNMQVNLPHRVSL